MELNLLRLPLLSCFCVTSFIASGQGVTITSGAQFNMNGNVQLVLDNGGLTNNGIVSTTGTPTVALTGNGPTANSAIGGTGTTQLSNLLVNKTANNAIVTGPLSVSGNLTLQSNNLELDGNSIDLGSTGTIVSEDATSYIDGATGGAVTRTVDLNAPNAVNPGNIGLEITSSQNLGSTTITRYNNIISLSPQDSSIALSYLVQPTNNNNLNASVKIFYQDENLNSTPEADLNVWQFSTSSNSWLYYGKDASDVSLNYVQKNNMDTLNHITLGTHLAPLSLGLISFKGKLIKDNEVQLDWITINEKENKLFDVERSYNGRDFALLGTVNSKGDNTQQQAYAYIDEHPLSDVNFYRLKSIDVSGNAAYSTVVRIDMPTLRNKVVSVYPNPTHDKVAVSMTSTGDRKVYLRIYDAFGKMVGTQEFGVLKGDNKVEVSLLSFASGAYFLRFDNEAGAIKVVKEN